jgi:hypothetical protein
MLKTTFHGNKKTEIYEGTNEPSAGALPVSKNPLFVAGNVI